MTANEIIIAFVKIYGKARTEDDAGRTLYHTGDLTFCVYDVDAVEVWNINKSWFLRLKSVDYSNAQQRWEIVKQDGDPNSDLLWLKLRA